MKTTLAFGKEGRNLVFGTMLFILFLVFTVTVLKENCFLVVVWLFV